MSRESGKVTYTSTVTYPPGTAGGAGHWTVTSSSAATTTTRTTTPYGIDMGEDYEWVERRHPRQSDGPPATLAEIAKEYFEERRAELVLSLEERWHEDITIEEVLDLVNRAINAED